MTIYQILFFISKDFKILLFIHFVMVLFLSFLMIKKKVFFFIGIFLFSINLFSFSDSAIDNSTLNSSSDLAAAKSVPDTIAINLLDSILVNVITYAPHIILGGFAIGGIYYTYQYWYIFNNVFKLFLPGVVVPHDDVFFSNMSDLFIRCGIHQEIKCDIYVPSTPSNIESILTNSIFEGNIVSPSTILDNTQPITILPSVLNSNTEINVLPLTTVLNTVVEF